MLLPCKFTCVLLKCMSQRASNILLFAHRGLQWQGLTKFVELSNLLDVLCLMCCIQCDALGRRCSFSSSTFRSSCLDPTSVGHWSVWGFWALHHSLFAAVYGTILALPFTRYRDRLPGEVLIMKSEVLTFDVRDASCFDEYELCVKLSSQNKFWDSQLLWSLSCSALFVTLCGFAFLVCAC